MDRCTPYRDTTRRCRSLLVLGRCSIWVPRLVGLRSASVAPLVAAAGAAVACAYRAVLRGEHPAIEVKVRATRFLRRSYVLIVRHEDVGSHHVRVRLVQDLPYGDRPGLDWLDGVVVVVVVHSFSCLAALQAIVKDLQRYGMRRGAVHGGPLDALIVLLKLRIHRLRLESDWIVFKGNPTILVPGGCHVDPPSIGRERCVRRHNLRSPLS
jgi:hypothetical protein